MGKRKLKIAVQFFGHLRTYKKCARFLKKNLLDKYDCDLFMHTWSKLNHNTITWHDNKEDASETREGEIIRAYGRMKGLEIEEQRPKDLGIARFLTRYNGKPGAMSIFGVDALWHSLRRSNELREDYEKKNKLEYDFIVCVRPDVCLYADIGIEKLLATQCPEVIDKGFFTFAYAFTKVIRGFQSLGAADAMFFAKPGLMSDIFRKLPSAAAVLSPGVTCHHGPEYEFIKTVQALGYITCRLDYRYGEDWEIIRKELNRRRLIRLRIRGHSVLLWLLPGVLPPVFDFRVKVLGIFTIDMALGNPRRHV